MRELLRRFFADPFAKVASLVIALFAWLYVQSDQIHEARIQATLQWRLPPGRTATVSLPDTTTLVIRGTYAATRRAQDAGVRMVVDATALTLGKQTIDLTNATAIGLPGGVEVVGHQPAELELVLDERLTRKVKVEAVQVGDPAVGFLVDSVDLEPAVVQITWSMIADIATEGPLIHSHSGRLITWVSASTDGGAPTVHSPSPSPTRWMSPRGSENHVGPSIRRCRGTG